MKEDSKGAETIRENCKRCYEENSKEVVSLPYNSKAFGHVISRLRVQKGLSQEVVSGLAGISRSHLAMCESGKKTMRLDTLWRVAQALAIKPSELIRLVEAENPPD